MPDNLRPSDIAAINETLSFRHYSLTPLVTREHRIRIFGSAGTIFKMSSLAVNAFTMYLVQPAPDGIDIETIVAAPPGQADMDFIRSHLALVNAVLPCGEDFPLPIKAMAKKLGAMGLQIMSGLVLFSNVKQTEEFPALILPRIFRNEFKGPNDPETSDKFGIGLAAAAFLFLSQQQLKGYKDPTAKADE